MRLTDEHDDKIHQLHPQADPSRPRRRVTWTYAFAVSFCAFMLWMLIDAPTLQHNAQVSPVGARRTVSLDVLGPIATLSRGLQVSHIVSIANGVLGRSGNQPGSGSSVVESVGPSGPSRPGSTGHTPRGGPPPTVVPGGGVTTTSAPSTQHPSAANPLRVLVVGDSIGLDLGGSLINDLANTGVVTATLDGKESTGLTRPDYFNWPAELQGDLAKYNPQVVVIMIGANDPQDFPGPPDIPYGTSQWTAMYTSRVAAFMQEATSGGASAIWVGMPPMQNPSLSSEMQTLDGIVSGQALKTPNVLYVDGWSVLGSAPGVYSAYLLDNGQEVLAREPDGTHVAPGGAEILSQAVMATMTNQLHIQL
jgi:uncharacterized protein